jgi:hypothetical protein
MILSNNFVCSFKPLTLLFKVQWLAFMSPDFRLQNTALYPQGVFHMILKISKIISLFRFVSLDSVLGAVNAYSESKTQILNVYYIKSILLSSSHPTLMRVNDTYVTVVKFNVCSILCCYIFEQQTATCHTY